jgi:hypothetical protein
MNRLRKAVRDYLTMRRGLGFKLVRHETGLQEFVSFLERKRSLHITVNLALEWAHSIPTKHPVSGRRDSASYAASPGTGVRRIPRRKFRRSVCCLIGPNALSHTSIPIPRSEYC